MRKNIFIFLLLLTSGAFASPTHNFEGDMLPKTVTVEKGKSELMLSKKYYKQGEQSLLWSWYTKQATLLFSDVAIAKSADSFDKRGGLKLWIYNETPLNDPLLFRFSDAEGSEQYRFTFNLEFVGWRAAWIAYSDMWGTEGEKTTKQEVVSMEIVSPEKLPAGRIWIDRVEFTGYVDRQATPDAQIPHNNRHLDREIWHWGLLHKWEQQADEPIVPVVVTPGELSELNLVYERTKQMLRKGALTEGEQQELKGLEKRFSISEDGTKGAPLMQNDNAEAGDVHFGQLNRLLDLSARGWYNGNDREKKELFVKAIRYMLHQGFAKGSGMGTNHHYGYQIREIFGAVWWMEDILRKENLWAETRAAITYWSGLQESRKPFNPHRDEITDSWNTLLIPRLACALMGDTENERLRDLTALSRWVNGSLRFSPGTIGGIKVDGTAFHHGGHYPAYAVPGLAYVGKYLKCVNHTRFTLNGDAFAVLKFGLLSIARQTNLRDWGIGVSGRHPFNGSISQNGLLTFAYAAMAPATIDRELAGEYLRLLEGMNRSKEDQRLILKFIAEGIKPNDPPSGFYVYNYASQGIYRYHNKMISFKGFSRNIWGSEIYAGDNRFGRYQSYGSIQILGTPSPTAINGDNPVTEEASRYSEEGWDWNRNPGTTTIHLPLELLNSPFQGSDMLRQPESFAGASYLQNGTFGMFASKLGERDRPHFTPSFHARKSAFAFGNRVIALGSGISNDNNRYPTETTLFQQRLNKENETILTNKFKMKRLPAIQSFTGKESEATLIRSLTGDYYYIPSGQSLVIEKKWQESKGNKRMNPTRGMFATAYFNHGKAPQNSSYEYMILLDASPAQLSSLKKGNSSYVVKRKDEIAHIVMDQESKARGYALFEELTGSEDDYLLQGDGEIMVMLQPRNEQLHVSICDPDMHLGEYQYTTSTESRPVNRSITLKGRFRLQEINEAVSLTHKGHTTRVTVTTRHGIPVEFTLEQLHP
ncbi:MAG: chondroitinase family polysaccharide lyase [Proteiniphilum sp.]|nr:chondroitinase family polysaccharide lyase [Proteiniphilum sp.]